MKKINFRISEEVLALVKEGKPIIASYLKFFDAGSGKKIKSGKKSIF